MDKKEFKKTLEERLEKRLEIQSFDEMTVQGSKIRFDMAMAIMEYPFEIPDGANEQDYEALLTEQEYMAGKFDDVIDAVFDAALLKQA
jgi:hypothetical protein